MTLIKRAFLFASKKHKGQKDDEGKMYLLHVHKVALLLAEITDDEDVISAGLLHDTIEDTDTSYDELKEKFGQRVADLVMEVSHEDNGDKGMTFPRLKTREGIMIKFADRLSNISRMGSWDNERKEHYLRRSKFWKNSVDDKIIEGQKR